MHKVGEKLPVDEVSAVARRKDREWPVPGDERKGLGIAGRGELDRFAEDFRKAWAANGITVGLRIIRRCC